MFYKMALDDGSIIRAKMPLLIDDITWVGRVGLRANPDNEVLM